MGKGRTLVPRFGNVEYASAISIGMTSAAPIVVDGKRANVVAVPSGAVTEQNVLVVEPSSVGPVAGDNEVVTGKNLDLIAWIGDRHGIKTRSYGKGIGYSRDQQPLSIGRPHAVAVVVLLIRERVRISTAARIPQPYPARRFDNDVDRYLPTVRIERRVISGEGFANYLSGTAFRVDRYQLLVSATCRTPEDDGSSCGH